MNKGKPPILAICGVKNSGKTTYLEQLVAELSRLGLRVAVIKHDGHEFEGDVPGTDSWRMYRAGAWGTAVFSRGQLLLRKRQEGAEVQRMLEDLQQAFGEADLILVEGMKALPLPKLEIIRGEKPPLPVSNPQGRLGILTNVTADREEFAARTGYRLKEREGLYDLENPRKMARKLKEHFLSQGGSTWEKS